MGCDAVGDAHDARRDHPSADAGYDVGGGYRALVLYAEPTRLTLKYTREDDVVSGYTIHLENICVDANLLALYRSSTRRADRNCLRCGRASPWGARRAPRSMRRSAIVAPSSIRDHVKIGGRGDKDEGDPNFQNL